MNRLTLLRLLDERRKKHEAMVSNGHEAMIPSVKADELLINRVREMPNYVPGFCAICEGELLDQRVRGLAIDCVPCVEGTDSEQHMLLPERRRSLVAEFVRESNPARAQRLWSLIIDDYIKRVGTEDLAARWGKLSFAEQETIVFAEIPEISYGVLRQSIHRDVEEALSRITPIEAPS